jgi:cytoskeletal protein RodZ
MKKFNSGLFASACRTRNSGVVSPATSDDLSAFSDGTPVIVKNSINFKTIFFIACFRNAATAENESRHEHTPSNNPQREDLIKKPKKERADPEQREKKIASLQTAAAEIPRIQRGERTVAVPNSGSQDQSVQLATAQLVLSPICFRPFCRSRMQARSRATSRMIESRNTGRPSSASRRSPSSITTLPASRASADTLR